MIRIALGLLLSFALVACDGSNTPAAPGGGTGGTFGPPVPGGGGSSGMGGQGGTAGGGGAGGTGTGTGGTAGSAGMDGGTGGFGGIAIGDGACDNVDDVRKLAALQPDNGRSVAATCGVACEECAESIYVSLVTECVMDNVPGVGMEPDLSEECATCYAEFAACLGFDCNQECAADSCSDDCERERMCERGDYADCFNDLTACAGRNSRDCGEA